MASGVNDERSGVGVYVLERHPYAAHKSLWKWCQVNQILMYRLLTPVDEVECLARNGLVVEDRGQNFQYLRMSPEGVVRLCCV